MKELVFATVLTELKTSWEDAIAVPDLINLLYDAIAEPVGLTIRMAIQSRLLKVLQVKS